MWRWLRWITIEGYPGIYPFLNRRISYKHHLLWWVPWPNSNPSSLAECLPYLWKHRWILLSDPGQELHEYVNWWWIYHYLWMQYPYIQLYCLWKWWNRIFRKYSINEEKLFRWYRQGIRSECLQGESICERARKYSLFLVGRLIKRGRTWSG